MMKKKLLCGLLAAVMALSLAEMCIRDSTSPEFNVGMIPQNLCASL